MKRNRRVGIIAAGALVLVMGACGEKSDRIVTINHPMRELGQVRITISDNSLSDPGGAAYFFEALTLTNKDGVRVRNKEALGESPTLAYHPEVIGGIQMEGYLLAENDTTIVLSYDLLDPHYLAAAGPALEQIEEVDIALIVANDFHVEVVVAQEDESRVSVRAIGEDVQDGSNQQFIHFELRDISRSRSTIVARQVLYPGRASWWEW